jgi:hypothetical protein
MKSKFLAAAAVAAIATACASRADALVFVTQLDYDNSGLIQSVGTVTITDGLKNNTEVQIQVDLDAGKFVDTGNGHVVFAFNMQNDGNDVVKVVEPAPGGTDDFIYQNDLTQTVLVCGKGKGATCNPVTQPTNPPPYAESPFGTFSNAFDLKFGGGNNTVAGPFIFTVDNKDGITFAGLNPTIVNGQLVGLGTGLHFLSNTTGTVGTGQNKVGPGGWWFAADTSGTDSNCSPTCAVAGRDAFLMTGVPEPATWALMIMGFGGLGAVMRRRKAAMLAA